LTTQNDKLKEWLSPIAIATYIGSIGSIVAVLNKELAVALIVVTTLAAVLLIGNIHFYRRYSRYKRYTEIDHLLHRLTHRTRDYILDLRIETNSLTVEEITASAIKMALSTGADIFTKLTNTQCTASLMLLDDKKLQTVQYCFQVNPERESRRSKELDIGEGIAGQAFATGDLVVWDQNNQAFKQIREDSFSFYTSGFSIPFKAGRNYAGLFNIDSLSVNIFRKSKHKQIAAAIADQIALIIEASNLWSDLHEAN
jgi:transcriptional regulator with GAF, ATPase, and Fis domain